MLCVRHRKGTGGADVAQNFSHGDRGSWDGCQHLNSVGTPLMTVRDWQTAEQHSGASRYQYVQQQQQQKHWQKTPARLQELR